MLLPVLKIHQMPTAQSKYVVKTTNYNSSYFIRAAYRYTTHTHTHTHTTKWIISTRCVQPSLNSTTNKAITVRSIRLNERSSTSHAAHAMSCGVVWAIQKYDRTHLIMACTDKKRSVRDNDVRSWRWSAHAVNSRSHLAIGLYSMTVYTVQSRIFDPAVVAWWQTRTGSRHQPRHTLPPVAIIRRHHIPPFNFRQPFARARLEFHRKLKLN